MDAIPALLRLQGTAPNLIAGLIRKVGSVDKARSIANGLALLGLLVGVGSVGALVGVGAAAAIGGTTTTSTLTVPLTVMFLGVLVVLWVEL